MNDNLVFVHVLIDALLYPQLVTSGTTYFVEMTSLYVFLMVNIVPSFKVIFFTFVGFFFDGIAVFSFSLEVFLEFFLLPLCLRLGLLAEGPIRGRVLYDCRTAGLSVHDPSRVVS